MLDYYSRTISFSLLIYLCMFSHHSFANENELIIKFEAEVTAQATTDFLTEYGVECFKEIKAMNMCVVELSVTGEQAALLIQKMEKDSRTKYVEKNTVTGSGGYIPNDALLDDQWHHETLNNRDAWDITRGSGDVVIAVLDSGIQAENIEFSGPRFLRGYDFVDDDNTPEDGHGHGTHVTGLIAANADNNIGGAGVDHRATILPVRVLNNSNSGSTFDLLQGINYAVDQGADIISMSLINYSGSTALIDALQTARDSGVILIACAGNGGFGNADVSYPGASPLTISIGSTNGINNRASSSGTGAALDFVAPGSILRTTRFSNSETSLDAFRGCSAAVPLVAGVAGLIKSVNPNITHEELNDIFILTSRDQVSSDSQDTPGRDNNYGWGLIDSLAAVEAAAIPGLIPTPAPTPAPTPGTANLSCTHSTTNAWQNGFTANMELSNTGSNSISTWEVCWEYTDGSARTSGWNANVSGSSPYCATGVGWNNTIRANQTIVFGVQGVKTVSGAPQVRITSCTSQ